MEQQMIFFDIDGTIIAEGTGMIPKSLSAALKNAQSNGHLLFINTGRTWPAIEDRLKELGFDGMVCGCGTYIRYKDQVILRRELGNELSKEIAQDLENWDIDGILEGSRNVYHRYHAVLPVVKRLRSDFEKMPGHQILFWEQEDINFDKMAIWLNTGSNFYSFRNKYNEMFEFIHREGNFYELVPRGFSKATGIEFLVRYLNKSVDNTMAFGDSMNDLSMLKYVHLGIAMGNSHRDLLPAAGYVTDCVEMDGIHKALEHFAVI